MSLKPLTPKQKFWKEHIEKCAESGLSAKEYCERNGLQPKHLVFYKSTLKSRQRKEKPSFVKVHPVPLPSVTFHLGNGVRMECPHDPALISQMVKISLEASG